MLHDGAMARRPSRTRPVARKHRRHGAPLRQPDRRALELDGWRTTLDYRENHRRGPDARLLGVSSVWHAEAERTPVRRRGGTGAGDNAGGRGIDVIWATADTAEGAWSRLRLEAELADVRVDVGVVGDRVAGSP